MRWSTGAQAAAQIEKYRLWPVPIAAEVGMQGRNGARHLAPTPVFVVPLRS